MGTVLLGTGWLAYSIYDTRFPREQIEPDPSKKTLVILGISVRVVGLGLFCNCCSSKC